MGDDAKQTFAQTSLRRSTSQGRSQAAFVLREGAFGVPAPTVKPGGEAGMHPSPVAAAGTDMLVSGSATIHGDDGRADAQCFTGQTMMRFCVVAGVGQQAINGDVSYRLRHRRLKVDGVIAGAVSGRCRGDQISGMMGHHGQFGVPSVSLRTADHASQEVPADVMAFQARGVDRGLGLLVDQAAFVGNTENSGEEPLKSPFLRSRSCAF